MKPLTSGPRAVHPARKRKTTGAARSRRAPSYGSTPQLAPAASITAHPLLPEHTDTGQTVRLRLKAPGARTVAVAGSFNGWAIDEYMLKPDRDGWWSLEIAIPPGRHEYRFVMDGEWVNGASPDGYAPNPFGSMNCVLVVR